MKTKIEIPKPQTAKFVPVSEIIPQGWDCWFYTAISENSPFSWGDNNRTLIDAISFGHHVEDVLDVESSFGNESITETKRKTFFDILSELGKKRIYVDLEN